MTGRAFHRLATSAAASLMVALVPHAAQASEASPWDNGTHSAARLIAAGAIRDQGAARLRAGVELKLRPGWKTYWRYPGDSGVPPRFDFARSENVRDVTVLWPAPKRFSDGSGMSIGYAEAVVFPLRITPADERKPVLLRVDLDYGVCEKLCVPVEAKLELALTTRATAHDALLAASEARVPVSVAIGPRQPLAVVGVGREAERTPARVVVDVAANEPVDLFAEGPTPEWALPLPQPVDGAPAGVKRFAFELDGLPPGAKPAGTALKLTATSATSAVEVVAQLD
jgi:DsbC/DsbD-like thiol-disulfide interchange protein